ncbi:ImmA/IrrE family metallo-endopeptidase [Lactobacillus gasseri]|nr:ImmA/IrrE family metallo-endopeptidase [Lactobacillus gasseri]
MDSHLKYLLKKYNLHLQYGPSHEKGCIVRTPAGLPDLLMVKEGLSDEETEKVILHEIGHAKNDPSVVGDYKYIGSAHSCSEYGANNFMVHEKIKQFIALGNEPDEANYINIAVSPGISNFDEVREELLKYVAK